MLQRLADFLFLNSSTRQRVLKNTFWLFFGQIGARLAKLGLVVYAARALGADGWGAFSYALGIAALFTIFTDFGVNAIITREASKDPEIQKQYFATALVIKIILFLLSCALIIFIAPILIGNTSITIILPLVALIVGFDSLRDFAAAMSRAWEKMEIEATMHVVTNLLILILGLGALFFSPTAYSLALGYAVGTGLGMILSFIPCRSYFREIKKVFSKHLIKPIILSSLPFAISGLMGAVLLNTDTILIGWLLKLTDVGYYAAAQRVALLIYMIPGLLAIAFFPSMAKFSNDPLRQRFILEKITALQFLAALPLTIGGVLLSSPIISLLYGSEYAPATLSFLIMNLTYLPVFLTTVFTNSVFAISQEKKLFISSFVGIVGNFVLDILLIPLWGIAGSALATVFNQTIVAIFLWHFLKKQTGFTIFPHIKKILLANFLMLSALLFFTQLSISLYIIIPIGVILYVGTLLFLKEEMIFETLTVFSEKHVEVN